MKRNYLFPPILIFVLVLSCVLVSSCTQPTDVGTLIVNVTLDDSPWTGSVDYAFDRQGRGAISGSSAPQSFSVATGTWSFISASGGPSGADLYSITPSPMQTLPAGGKITFNLNFTTPE